MLVFITILSIAIVVFIFLVKICSLTINEKLPVSTDYLVEYYPITNRYYPKCNRCFLYKHPFTGIIEKSHSMSYVMNYNSEELAIKALKEFREQQYKTSVITKSVNLDD